jgi:hypothetical protein
MSILDKFMDMGKVEAFTKLDSMIEAKQEWAKLHKLDSLRETDVPEAFKGWIALAGEMKDNRSLLAFISASLPLEKTSTILKQIDELNRKTKFAEYLYDRLDEKVALIMFLEYAQNEFVNFMKER